MRDSATNLVFLEPDRLDSEPFTTSEVIAEYAGVQHHTVTRLLRDYGDDFASFGPLGFEIHAAEHSRGYSEVKSYHLNEP